MLRVLYIPAITPFLNLCSLQSEISFEMRLEEYFNEE